MVARLGSGPHGGGIIGAWPPTGPVRYVPASAAHDNEIQRIGLKRPRVTSSASAVASCRRCPGFPGMRITRPLAVRVVGVRAAECRGHPLGLFGDGSPLSG
jgi:hypothetical protein